MYIEREKERLYVRIFDCLKLLPINRSILYFSIINIPTYAYVYILKLDSPSRFFRSAHFGFDRSSRQTFHVYFNISFERNEVCAIFGLERVLKSVITVKILCFFFVFQATEKGRKEERKRGTKNKERRKKIDLLAADVGDTDADANAERQPWRHLGRCRDFSPDSWTRTRFQIHWDLVERSMRP